MRAACRQRINSLMYKMPCSIICFSSLQLILVVQILLSDEVYCDLTFRHNVKTPFKSDLNEGQDHKCKENSTYVWCTPSNYNAEDDPFRYTSLTNIPLPWSYDFKFIIKEVSNVNDKAQSISVSMYFGVRWFEPRLVINETAEDWTEPKLGPDDHVNVSPETIKDLWYPDLEIYGLEKFDLQKVLKEMSGVRIIKNQTIDYELRAVITISCHMNFNNYPLDSHTCPFQIGSYFGTVKTVTCSSYYEFDEDRQRSLQYFTTIIPLLEEDQNVTLPSGNYAACGFTIKLRRMRMQNLIQVYVPSTMFVMVSWVSFLIKPEVIPGRMALLITLFLVLINIFNGVKADAPASKQLNAVDLYLVVCIFLVFAALVEYSVILYIQKKVKKPSFCKQQIYENHEELLDANPSPRHKRHASQVMQLKNQTIKTPKSNKPGDAKSRLYQIGQDNVEVDGINDDEKKTIRKNKKIVSDHYTECICENIDMISLWISPLLFIIFSIVYWIVYY